MKLFRLLLVCCEIVHEILCQGIPVSFKSDITSDKIFLKCKVPELLFTVHFYGPDWSLRGYCPSPFTQQKETCSNGITQDVQSNTTTLVVNRPITEDIIGEWRCYSGVGQAYDTVVIKTTESYCGEPKQDDGRWHAVPEQKSYIWIDRNLTYFNMTCFVYQHPLGDSVDILLNSRTINVLRLYNNKCFLKDKECGDFSCSCGFSEGVFVLYYIYTNLNECTNCTFGVDMIAKKLHGKQTQVTLSRVYNGTDFGKLEIVSEPIQAVYTIRHGQHIDIGCGKSVIMADGITVMIVIIVCIQCLILFNMRKGFVSHQYRRIKRRTNDDSTSGEDEQIDRKAVINISPQVAIEKDTFHTVKETDLQLTSPLVVCETTPKSHDIRWTKISDTSEGSRFTNNAIGFCEDTLDDQTPLMLKAMLVRQENYQNLPHIDWIDTLESKGKPLRIYEQSVRDFTLPEYMNYNCRLKFSVNITGSSEEYLDLTENTYQITSSSGIFNTFSRKYLRTIYHALLYKATVPLSLENINVMSYWSCEKRQFYFTCENKLLLIMTENKHRKNGHSKLELKMCISPTNRPYYMKKPLQCKKKQKLTAETPK